MRWNVESSYILIIPRVNWTTSGQHYEWIQTSKQASFIK